MPIDFFFGKKKADKKREQPVILQEPGGNRPISGNLDENERLIRETFRNCADLVVRRIVLQGGTSMLIVFLDGMVEAKALDDNLLNPLLYEQLPPDARQISQLIQMKAVAITTLKTVNTFGELVFGILSANAILLVDGMTEGLQVDVKGFQTRSVEEPMTEAAVRGPRDGFTESLRINTTLLRRRIRSSRLKFEPVTLGELTRTDCLIVYIEGLAPESLIAEVRNRISRIRVDSILESQYVEELIEDNPYSPFPQIQDTERPDIVAGSLLEGKVAVLVDNTPFALIMPFTFWSGLQAREDYYDRFLYSGFIRLIRFVFFLLSLLLPSLYVALTTFHPKLLPTNLLISIAAARENVPFPALIEALMMELVFEALREAGIRMPRAVGSAVNIVGALVIGQSAVQAGIVSAPMVIVVAATGIASFLIPRHAIGTSVDIIRFVLLILAGFLGLYGVAIGIIALSIHLVNLQSFGVPYFSPVAPHVPGDSTDIILRAPRRLLNRRNS